MQLQFKVSNCQFNDIRGFSKYYFLKLAYLVEKRVQIMLPFHNNNHFRCKTTKKKQCEQHQPKYDKQIGKQKQIKVFQKLKKKNVMPLTKF